MGSDPEMDVVGEGGNGEEAVALVVKGMNNRKIGEQLHLATDTVRNHVSEIMGKLAVSDRTQAAVLAVQMGLVSVSDIG